ncbi:MAG: hypothetical protein WCK02_01975 [Bacteroidota bacterium]
MDFITFVLTTEKKDDSEMLGFVSAIKRMEGVPVSSDPRLLGRYLYRKLTAEQTYGFQKWFLFYKSMKDHEIPADLIEEKSFLVAINLINILQNSDPDYRK